MAEAKVAALCEVLERDSDATTLYDPKRCFRIETDDPEISQLLENYKTDGIDVWFMDVTPELGIPCYKSVVLGQHGDVNKGSGCDLNGKSALVSAMTETAYPYPRSRKRPCSGRSADQKTGRPARLLDRQCRRRPDGSGKTLMDNGYRPAYADLTRKDLQIPVTRAIVPGLEIISDFDQYSRVSPRLFNNYLAMFK